MRIFDFLKKKPKKHQLNEQDLRWNKFIEEICFREISSLNEIQKIAVLSFWYDAEMNSGGHSGYFDCYPDTSPSELEEALIELGGFAIAVNYRSALSNGEEDGFVETDTAFYKFSPSLTDLLRRFVEENRDGIFK